MGGGGSRGGGGVPDTDPWPIPKPLGKERIVFDTKSQHTIRVFLLGFISPSAYNVVHHETFQGDDYFLLVTKVVLVNI